MSQPQTPAEKLQAFLDKNKLALVITPTIYFVNNEGNLEPQQIVVNEIKEPNGKS